MDAVLVAMSLLHERVGRLKFTKRIFLLTNAASPIEWLSQGEETLHSVYEGIRAGDYRVNVIGVDFQDVLAADDDDIPMVRHGSEVDRRSQAQKQNEALLRDLCDKVDGAVYGVDSAIQLMSRLKKRINQVTKYRGPLEVGDVKIHVCSYTQTAPLPLPTLKREVLVEGRTSDDDGQGEGGEGDGDGEGIPGQAEGGAIQQVRAYFDRTSEHPEEVQADMRVKGFRYGKDHVPFGEDEMELLKYECDRCLKVLAFTDSSQVCRWQYMSAVDCVAPERGDEESAKAFTAFVWGMMELNQVALCRYVARRNAKPQLVALIPDIAAEGGERFYLVQLPFAEDMRSGTVEQPTHICAVLSLVAHAPLMAVGV